MIFSMFHTLLLIGFSIFYCRVSCDVRLTLVVGDMLVSRKAHRLCEAGWHRDDFSSLTGSNQILSGTFLVRSTKKSVGLRHIALLSPVSDAPILSAAGSLKGDFSHDYSIL